MELKRKVVVEKIKRKHQKAMRNALNVHTINKYHRIMQAEFGIDAKAFCNYFTSFYYAG